MREPRSLRELSLMPYDDGDWWHFVGFDPARAPNGDYAAVSVVDVPAYPEFDPWLPILRWCGQVRGRNMYDLIRGVMSGPLEAFGSFRRMAIDRVHDPSVADILAERYPRRCVGRAMTSEYKESMWKDTYMCLKHGMRLPTKTIDPMFNESVTLLRRQIDEYQLTFTPTGKVALHHGKKGHDDLLDSFMLALKEALDEMRVAVTRQGDGAEVMGTRPVTRQEVEAEQFVDMTARMHAMNDEARLL